jgi:hypothetical protein
LALEAEQGYLIIAVNRDGVDYVGMATRLCHSLKLWHPDAKVCLLTDSDIAIDGFDFVKTLPFGDRGSYANDWQASRATPFRETIKLESDMLVASPIDHWWNMLRHRDVVVSVGARDFYDRPVESRYYRKAFDINGLPDVYNAITYWRLSQTAHDFWTMVRSIFENWKTYRSLLKFAPHDPDTDLVYAMAAEIIGRDIVTLPFSSYPKIIHMKKHIIPTQTSDWTDELTWEYVNGNLRINTVSQWGCFHYHVKSWNPHA